MFKIFYVIFEGKVFWYSQKAGKLSYWLTCSCLLLGCGGGGGSENGNTNIMGTGPGTATLSWKAPTTNADETPLTDLAGYKVYLGIIIQSQSHYLLGVTD